MNKTNTPKTWRESYSGITPNKIEYGDAKFRT
jgi:hypothetical protein